MIVLDTNVVSELMKSSPNPAVVKWVDARDSSDLVLTALTAAELRAGVALLPDGHRKDDVGTKVEALLTETFAGFILAFDAESTGFHAQILAARTRAAHPIGAFDAQIAAVCRQHDASLATRNTSDFTGTDVALVDPWG